MFHRVFKPYTPFALVSLRSHARARPRCVYWHFPVLSADGLRHSKQIPASAKGQNGSDDVLVGGTNGNRKRDTNGGIQAVVSGQFLSPPWAPSPYTLLSRSLTNFPKVHI